MKAGMALLAGAVVLMAGCQQSPPATTQPRPAAPAPAPEPNATEPAAGEAPRKAPLIVTYTRSGGFAGRHEVLTVHEDGLLEFNVAGQDLVSHRVDPVRIAQLKAMLEDPAFLELKGPYESRGADLITYTVAAETSQGTTTVVAMDGSDRPEHLRRILRELSLLREAAVLQTEARD